MNAATRMIPKHTGSNEPVAKTRARQMPIAVRIQFGDELYGMRVYEDGVTFHSTSPLPVGKTVELILCGGAIVVDAEIVECDPIIDSLAGFAIRTRYAQSSADMRALITEELTRQIQAEGQGHDA